MIIPNIGILVKQDNIDLVDSKGQISKRPAIQGGRGIFKDIRRGHVKAIQMS